MRAASVGLKTAEDAKKESKENQDEVAQKEKKITAAEFKNKYKPEDTEESSTSSRRTKTSPEAKAATDIMGDRKSIQQQRMEWEMKLELQRLEWEKEKMKMEIEREERRARAEAEREERHEREKAERERERQRWEEQREERREREKAEREERREREKAEREARHRELLILLNKK